MSKAANQKAVSEILGIDVFAQDILPLAFVKQPSLGFDMPLHCRTIRRLHEGSTTLVVVKVARSLCVAARATDGEVTDVSLCVVDEARRGMLASGIEGDGIAEMIKIIDETAIEQYEVAPR